MLTSSLFLLVDCMEPCILYGWTKNDDEQKLLQTSSILNWWGVGGGFFQAISMHKQEALPGVEHP